MDNISQRGLFIVLVCCPFIENVFNFLLLLHWFFLLLLLILLPLCSFLLLPPPPDQGLTQEKQRQMFQEHTTAPTPTPPICTGSAVNPRKELTIQARTHTRTKNTAAQICTGSTVVRLNEQYTHIHTYIYTHSKCCPKPLSVPDSSHPGVRPGVSVQGRGSFWAAGLANPAARGHRFSN